ncbi:MAG: YcaO-like family protein [Silvanigrellaceae bacterium]|nr:YcaO-like family protein [Silvanigrellaceae bacterium]
MSDQIPLKTIVNRSQIFPDFFLAKSGVKFSTFSGRSKLISGFGFSKNEDQAINSSKFEALEHFYATYDFNQNYIKKKNNFRGVNLKNNELRDFVPSEVVLGPVPLEIGKSADANGLGCHTSYEKAVEHGILEMIERHFLAQVWYGPMSVVEIPEIHSIISQFRIRLFTPSTSFVPMAIAVIYNLQDGIWALGSAVRLSMERAIEHAIQEAMMLIESSSNEKGFSYSEEIEQRILSLRNTNLSKLRKEFFESKITECKKGLLSMYMQLDEIIALTFDASKIWIIDFFKSKELNVIRAICPIAKNPRWLRACKLDIPNDPFC